MSEKKRALISVDPQNGFMPGGGLAVAKGDEIVPVINHISPKFDCIAITLDFHPKDHGSFASNNGVKPFTMGTLDGKPQVMWPDHCVQGTKGAEHHPDLKTKGFKPFVKGTDKNADSYSGFFDNSGKNPTGLERYLKAQGVEEVYICGLATDYCVKFTVLDAVKLGFKVYVIRDACRAVEMNEGDEKRAYDEMEKAGAKVINSSDV